jgi:UDP-2,3-diacylglucosamine pyrophosphatase LpxH
MGGFAWVSFLRLPAASGSSAFYPKKPALRPQRPVRHHRTIFLSDVHLGTRGCKAELLADFLAHNTCDTLYLAGDIIDGWRLKRHGYWTEAQTAVVRAILAKADDGTKVIYIPGNHDEFLRPYVGRTVAGIEIAAEAVHTTTDGRRLLVLHGDRFDGVIATARWLSHLGDAAYSLALMLNDRLHAVRQAFGLPYWSLSAPLKHRVKAAVAYVSRFEEAVAAATLSLDGIVCGHIHQAEMRRIGKILYCNDGDWVESCTALAEDARGTLEILRWAPSFAASALARAGSQPARQATPLSV